MMKGIILGALSLIALAFIAFCIWVQPAVAQQVTVGGCGPRKAVMEALRTQYGMEERWFGVERGNATVSLLLVNKAGSWVSLRVQPEVACIVASGIDPTLMFGAPV